MLECPHCNPNENNDKETLEYLSNFYCDKCGHPYYCSCARNNIEDNERPKNVDVNEDEYTEYIMKSYEEHLKNEKKKALGGKPEERKDQNFESEPPAF